MLAGPEHHCVVTARNLKAGALVPAFLIGEFNVGIKVKFLDLPDGAYCDAAGRL